MKTVPIGSLTLALICLLALISVRPLNLSLSNQKLAFKLRVKNPNSYDLPMQSLKFTARFAGQDIAEGASDKAVTLPAKGEAVMEVSVNAGINRVLERFRNMISSGTIELDYGVKGNIKLANWPTRIPFDVEGELNETDKQNE